MRLSGSVEDGVEGVGPPVQRMTFEELVASFDGAVQRLGEVSVEIDAFASGAFGLEFCSLAVFDSRSGDHMTRLNELAAEIHVRISAIEARVGVLRRM